MEQITIDKNWLEDNGFIYFMNDDTYHLIIDYDDGLPQVRYNLTEQWLFVNRWHTETNGCMSYFDKCMSTKKLKEVLKAFDIPF